MNGIFFPDANHDENKSVETFIANLEKLHKLGVRVVFLEFLYETVPEKDRAIEEDFLWCSGGRPWMSKSYCDIVKSARALEMKVVGLSKKEYNLLSKKDPLGNDAFRMMGPFDGVSSLIIKSHAADCEFVVFLGQAHWPLLNKFLPSLTLYSAVTEEPINTDDKNFSTRLWKLPSMIELANKLTFGKYFAAVDGLEIQNRSSIDGLFPNTKSDPHVESLLETFKKKEKAPMTIFEINYFYSKR